MPPRFQHPARVCCSPATLRRKHHGANRARLIAAIRAISWRDRNARPLRGRTQLWMLGGAMIRNRTIATLAALGGFIAALVLLSGPPSAKADELSDLRVNQELLQRRLDQLAQVPPGPAPAGPGAPVVGGSFPRSFLIPGTDTSLRVGGFGIGRVTWYLRGVQPSADLFGQGNALADRTEGSGGTGNLASIPLNGTASHSKSEAFFISGRSTRVFIDARTPTAWGEAQGYAEWDFNNSNNNVLVSGPGTVVPNYTLRVRQRYEALGPVLVG